jgi:copper chaperone CopZ
MEFMVISTPISKLFLSGSEAMDKFLAVMFIGVAAAVLNAGQAASTSVEVKGPHICCKQCVNVVAGILKKVDGVSDVKSDVKTKMVTFTAKDDKAAQAGVMALVHGGFFGSATEGGKEMKLTMPALEKGKADVVTVKDVHVCCGACEKAITNIFKDSKVTFGDTRPQKTVRIEGKDLDRAEVMETLHKTGFSGTLEK